MSRYDWEQGSLSIPTAAWKPLRDTLAQEFNKLQDDAYALAVALHAKLTAVKAAKGSKALHRNVYETLKDDETAKHLLSRLESSHATYVIQKSVQTCDPDGKVKLAVPKKKDFAHAVSTKQAEYPVGSGEGVIQIDHKDRRVTWRVWENNRAVERARDTAMGRGLFEALRRVKWTRGSGGLPHGKR